MAAEQPLKHIDRDILPNAELTKVWQLLMAKAFTDLELWANLAYVAGWAVLWLKDRQDSPIVFGGTAEEAEFCATCAAVYNWASEDAAVQRSAIGAWLVKAMLLALLNRLIVELAQSDQLPQWLRELLAVIKEQIEAL